MRQRLSWTEKSAEIAKKADPYTMNQDHPNNPVQKYDVGGPKEFGEDPDLKTPWKTEGRTETGHPAPVREAVTAARKLEDKALKCITIAQRMLPGADDSFIEEQATDLMYMPEKCILATLQRQAHLAEVLANDDGDEDDEKKKDAPAEVPAEAPKAAAKEEMVPPVEEKKEEKKEEKAAAVVPPVEEKKEEKKEEKAAAKEEMVPPVEEKKEEKKEDVEAAKKCKEEEETEVEASIDLLDAIFAESEPKTGAKKLSGIVKQASTGNNLDNLWDAPPDVSKAFR